MNLKQRTITFIEGKEQSEETFVRERDLLTYYMDLEQPEIEETVLSFHEGTGFDIRATTVQIQ